jgi:hypothetical protein
MPAWKAALILFALFEVVAPIVVMMAHRDPTVRRWQESQQRAEARVKAWHEQDPSR